MKADDSRDLWAGWIWGNGHWAKVCTAGNLGRCSHELGILGAKLGVAERHQCMTNGGCPGWTPSDAAAAG